MIDILVWAGVRFHFLIPHRLVGAFQDDRPTSQFSELEEVDGVWCLDREPVVEIKKWGKKPFATQATIKAHTDLWLQEAGVSHKLKSGGLWRGYNGPHPTRTTTGSDSWIPLNLRDPHRATIHWSRVRSSPRFTTSVGWKQDGERHRFFSGPGFARMLDRPAGNVPWEDCVITGTGGRKVVGAIVKTNESPIRVWELAGHPEGTWPGDPTTLHPASDWLHHHGWAGGAGGVVQAVPPYRADRILHPDVPVDHLWDPPTWRLLRAGQWIEQLVHMR